MEHLIHYAPLAAALYMFCVMGFISYNKTTLLRQLMWRMIPASLAILLLVPWVK